jgi:hypothetical protein
VPVKHRVENWGHLRVYAGMHLKEHACDLFQDNPLFSELIFRNVMNPSGAKTWQRYVPQQPGQAAPAFVPDDLETSPRAWQRLQRRWQRAGGGDFLELYGGSHACESPPELPWLICAPRDEILRYWYNTTLESWQHLVMSTLQRLGHTGVWRAKPERRLRTTNTVPRVTQIVQGYRGVITAHSVSAIDATLLGRPAVVWGQDPTLGLATPWWEFAQQGQHRVWTTQDLEPRLWTWAACTHHSLELQTLLENHDT